MVISNLKSVLAKKGMSQSELARHVGVMPPQVSRWAAGGGIEPETARKIAALLGVRVEDLIAPQPEQMTFPINNSPRELQLEREKLELERRLMVLSEEVQVLKKQKTDLLEEAVMAELLLKLVTRSFEKACNLKKGDVLKHLIEAAGGVVALAEKPMFARAVGIWDKLIGSGDATGCDSTPSSKLVESPKKKSGSLKPVTGGNPAKPDPARRPDSTNGHDSKTA